MDRPVVPDSSLDANSNSLQSGTERTQSFLSQTSNDSHTAADFINSQLQLEADAREALPYKFENCTKPIGKLRQVLFSCLSCNPPPSDVTTPYNPAGICYSCSIQCHGEHTLVELFNKRDFVCDCGTKRLPSTSPCIIRVNSESNVKGGIHSEEPASDNKYNQNFRNRFCGCECDYDAYKEKGTMFQCLGLGTPGTGGCGEDWWHPGCITGLGPDWYENSSQKGTSMEQKNEGLLPSVAEVAEKVMEEPTGETTGPDVVVEEELEDEEAPLPPGFPEEDSFEGFICYKCIDSNPWIKRYAGTEGFLQPVFRKSTAPSPETSIVGKAQEIVSNVLNPKKRKSEDDEDSVASGPAKRPKEEIDEPREEKHEDTSSSVMPAVAADIPNPCKTLRFPPTPTGQISLFFKSDFREHLCRCKDCFPLLAPHPQLMEEEEVYEPSISDSEPEAGGSTQGSGSIYDRGESALKNVDRVRAIEGVMAYNHLKEKLKPFFQQFAESGKAISAEDIKAHFAKMRGDEGDIKKAGEDAKKGGVGGDARKEQGGY